jgi:D-aminoacyl-tRNA deacylase
MTNLPKLCNYRGRPHHVSNNAPVGIYTQNAILGFMRACIQRVSRAEVAVAGQPCGSIGPGMLVLLGVANGDTEAEAKWLAEKIAGLRIFEDGEGKMNLSLADVGGSMLIVSQFTLLGDCRRGRRPDFTAAAPPEIAERLYNVFVHAVAAVGLPVATGRFRQHMLVELVNDGPVTLVVESG